MKIHHIEPTTFHSGVRIASIENSGHKYLYNEINSLIKDFKIPANFRTQEIELPSISDKVIQKLQELGIKFSNK